MKRRELWKSEHDLSQKSKPVANTSFEQEHAHMHSRTTCNDLLCYSYKYIAALQDHSLISVPPVSSPCSLARTREWDVP